jgi:hypothetical protein
MLTSRQSTLNVTKKVSPITQAKQIEDTRRKEVQLILENLFEREEATVKLVIDCLFDLGAVYLINRKIPTPIINPLVKRVAKISKSGIRIIAFRYVMKKFVLSGFLTNFLVNKVKGLVGANQLIQTNKKLPSQSKPNPNPSHPETALSQKKEPTQPNSQPFEIALPSGNEPINFSEKDRSSTPQISQDQEPVISQRSELRCASYPPLTPEDQQALDYHIQGIAKIIYQETNSHPHITLAQVEEMIRQQTIQSMIHTRSLVNK